MRLMHSGSKTTTSGWQALISAHCWDVSRVNHLVEE
jgi:hypothetical protein